MIRIELDETHGIAVVHAEQGQGLSRGDFEKLAAKVDDYLKSHDRLNGLVVATQRFPGWVDLKALTAHLEFVRRHHRKIDRLALATDSRVAPLARLLASLFVKPEFKRFSFAGLHQAKAWAASR